MQFNKKCYIFQKKIIDIFNEEENIPFLLKYYLFKDIWEKVQQNKFLIDGENRADETGQKIVSASVPIPDDFLQENNSEKEDSKNI